MSVDLADLTAASFLPLVGDDFHLGGDSVRLHAQLKEVRSLGQAVRKGGGFVLTFVQVPGAHLSQGTHLVVHPALGAVDMFLVPIGPVEGGLGYEAVFM